jgi:hypothetical protein
MAETISIEQIVEAAVSRILENHIPSLCQDLVRSVSREILPELVKAESGGLTGSSAGNGGNSEDLLRAISAIHAGTTQKEILRALLQNTVRYSGRGALFVIKSGMATGWQGRGFEDNDSIKDFSLDLRSGVAAQAMQTHTPCEGGSAEMDARFITHFRAPSDDKVLILPLLLKDKIAALVYADSGTNSDTKIDVASLQLIVAATGTWLEVISLRKQSQRDVVPELGEKADANPSAMSAAPSISDPFAAHSPKHISRSESQESDAGKTAVPEHAPMAMAASATDSSSSTRVASGKSREMSAVDQDTHRKAQRFARLLMDEIKLYNKDTLVEGRKNRDLYDRLKEDIEKSRSTYQKRYGSTVAADSDYFDQELIRSLAEDDASLLGVNYRH